MSVKKFISKLFKTKNKKTQNKLNYRMIYGISLTTGAFSSKLTIGEHPLFDSEAKALKYIKEQSIQAKVSFPFKIDEKSYKKLLQKGIIK